MYKMKTFAHWVEVFVMQRHISYITYTWIFVRIYFLKRTSQHTLKHSQAGKHYEKTKWYPIWYLLSIYDSFVNSLWINIWLLHPKVRQSMCIQLIHISAWFEIFHMLASKRSIQYVSNISPAKVEAFNSNFDFQFGTMHRICFIYNLSLQ